MIARIKELPAVDTETVFIGGLLHDVGRLFMLTHFPNLYQEALGRASESGGGLERFEQMLFGAGHSEVGAAVAEKWRLPGQLIDIVRDHEGPFDESASIPVMVVHCADAMAKSIFGSGEAILQFDIDAIAQDWLGFGTEEYRSVREEASERVEQASRVFGLLSAA